MDLLKPESLALDYASAIEPSFGPCLGPINRRRHSRRGPDRRRAPDLRQGPGLGRGHITKADCSQLVEHAPAPDVAYQPGVDVTGNSVAPADLNGGYQLELPETIVIDIEVDLLDRFGIPANPVLYDANAVIGRVEYRDGRATFNGQPLQDEAQAELSRRCQEILRAQQ